MRAGAKRKRWQESGLTQLTDLAQAAFDNGVGQSGEHSEAAACGKLWPLAHSRMRNTLPPTALPGWTKVPSLLV
jgi:hypothetical protein